MLQHKLYEQYRVLHLPPEMWDCVAKHRLLNDRGCFGDAGAFLSVSELWPCICICALLYCSCCFFIAISSVFCLFLLFFWCCCWWMLWFMLCLWLCCLPLWLFLGLRSCTHDGLWLVSWWYLCFSSWVDVWSFSITALSFLALGTWPLAQMW